MTTTARCAAAAVLAVAVGAAGATDLRGLFSAGKDVAKAVSLSDTEVVEGARLMMRQMDQEAQMAPAGSDYAKRLATLTTGHEGEDGLQLNFKVYMAKEVNAFAAPDGSIRVSSALMDAMSDDELRGVIGHEIGHAKLGHSKSQMKKALLLSAGTKVVGASGGKLGSAVAANTGTIQAFGNAQFSQADETASDDYGFAFLKKHGYDVKAMASAFRKLAQMEQGRRGISLMSSHPDPASRAERMAAKASMP